MKAASVKTVERKQHTVAIRLAQDSEKLQKRRVLDPAG